MPDVTHGSSVPGEGAPPLGGVPDSPANTPAEAGAPTGAFVTPPGAGSPPGEATDCFPAAYPPPARSRRGLGVFLGIVGLVIAIVGGAFAVALTRPQPGDKTATIDPAISPPPPWSGPLVADEIFPEEMDLTNHLEDEDRIFELDGAWDHEGDCPESGLTEDTEDYLEGCESRAEATYESTDGDFRVSFQVFAFPRDQNLDASTLDSDFPEDFEVVWKARSTMASGYWYQAESVGPFLVFVQVGPTGAWTEKLSEVCERLTRPAITEVVISIRDTLY